MKRNQRKKDTVSKEIKTNSSQERIVRIGTVFLLFVFAVSIFVVNTKYVKPVEPNSNDTLGKIIWDTIFSVPSGAIFVMEFVVSCLLLRFANQLRKERIVIMSCLIFFVASFDNVAIQYPFQSEWIALINFVAIIICVGVVLLQKGEILYVSQEMGFDTTEISRALGNTNNKKIISVQLYKVVTSQVSSTNGIDRIHFDVSHIGNDFVRAGYDVNNISRISYELDRDIVDAFPLVLNLYHEFRKKGDENIRNLLLASINEKIAMLEAKLQMIEDLPRSVTKDDCCIARALTIFLAFRHILNPPAGTKESQDDYIGEISLHDGDLKLNPLTEKQLFSMYRTGILGAALLDKSLRHVFYYHKDGAKSGRKYSVSQLLCDIGSEKNNFSSQTMYISLFTLEDTTVPFVPGYMFKSISEREAEITAAINKTRGKGELSA